MAFGALPSASKIYCNNDLPTVWLLDILTNLAVTCKLQAKISENFFNKSPNTGSHYAEPVHGLVTLYSGPFHVKWHSVIVFVRHPVP